MKKPAIDFGSPIVTNNEPIIRELVSEALKNRYPESILIPEYCGGSMTTRCDIMCIDSSRVIMVEVKGNKDTLDRLEYQLHDYYQHSTKVMLVMDVKHMESYQKNQLKYKPHHLIIHKDGKLIDRNPHGSESHFLPPSAIHLLWAEEKRQFFKDFDHKNKIPNNKIVDAVFHVFTPMEISSIVNEILFNRQEYLSSKDIRYHNGYTGGTLKTQIKHMGHKQLLLSEYLSTVLKRKLF